MYHFADYLHNVSFRIQYHTLIIAVSGDPWLSLDPDAIPLKLFGKPVNFFLLPALRAI